MVLSAWDFSTYRLPNRIVLPSYPIVLGLLAVDAGADGEWSALLCAVLAMECCVAGYLAIALVFPDQLGQGDVKLAGLIGAACGFLSWHVVLVGVFFGLVLGAVAPFSFIALGRAERQTPLPFAPFMLAGALFSIMIR